MRRRLVMIIDDRYSGDPALEFAIYASNKALSASDPEEREAYEALKDACVNARVEVSKE